MFDPNKPFDDWTFEELVAYNRGTILLSVGEGTFKDAVWIATDLAVRWRVEQDRKKKASEK